MKKYILVLVIALFSISTMFSQPPIPGGGTGEGGEGFCQCCEDDYIDPLTGAPYLGQEDAYDECYASCTAVLTLVLYLLILHYCFFYLQEVH